MIASEYKYIHDDFVTALDDAIDIDVTPVEVPGKANPLTVDYLIGAIHKSQKIAATKAYSDLTGFGLKEAKDAVEKEWVSVETKQQYRNRMIDIINQQIDNVPLINKSYTLKSFSNDQLLIIKDFINSF